MSLPENGVSGAGSEDLTLLQPFLSVNNIIGGMIYYIPFVESRVEFFRRRSLECAMANDKATGGGAGSNLPQSNSHSSGRHLSVLPGVPTDFVDDETDAMMWFRRMQKAEDHLKRLLAASQKSGKSQVEIGAVIDIL
ncbi:unnamed protein product [Phytomonas sp. Hart1]|nr:unnamed protein product [Phytomonas sp. Hart1]|eukprot:CCW70968.1 unnamed protein product [Phytomonas sp. isolate Hart1]